MGISVFSPHVNVRVVNKNVVFTYFKASADEKIENSIEKSVYKTR